MSLQVRFFPGQTFQSRLVSLIREQPELMTQSRIVILFHHIFTHVEEIPLVADEIRVVQILVAHAQINGEIAVGALLGIDQRSVARLDYHLFLILNAIAQEIWPRLALDDQLIHGTIQLILHRLQHDIVLPG